MPVAIEAFDYDTFFEQARRFHGYPAPGLLLGGFMVEEAKRHIPEGVLYDAIAETAWCLPDAIQMLTPCTVGNGWLKVENLGLYALSLYDKTTGQGVRVAVDLSRMAEYPEMRCWLMKERPKREQDSERLRAEIRTAGATVCTVRPVTVRLPMVARASKGDIAECPLCGQSYPAKHGRICRYCQGDIPYEPGEGATASDGPRLRAVPVEQAVGSTALHDMTRIEPGKSKGAAFVRGQLLDAGDVCRLQHMGRNRVYVDEGLPDGDWVHEDDCARAFGRGLAGGGVGIAGEVREGKANLVAERDGLFTVDEEALEAFNLVPGVMAATRHHGAVVRKGARLAATRAIPLFLARTEFDKAMRVLERGPVVAVRPLRKARAGILVTGTEVFNGLIEDRFAPIVTGKLKALGSEAAATIVVPDEREAVKNGALSLIEQGCDLIVTTAGLSVDPDDVTRHGLMDAGATDVRHGMPVLPGAMTLLARIGSAQVLGVPACALFYKTTSMDILLPRLLAGMDPDRRELARLGHGSLCQECKTCRYPRCPFGK
jgi:formylmethanofuran dehydrogenase subunit E